MRRCPVLLVGWGLSKGLEWHRIRTEGGGEVRLVSYASLAMPKRVTLARLLPIRKTLLLLRSQ